MTLTVNEICDEFEVSFSDFRKLPRFLIDASLSGRTPDGVTLLEFGKLWAFETMEHFQPRTHEILMNGSELVLVSRSGGVAGYRVKVLMDIRGQAIEIVRQRYGFNPSDETFPAKPYAGETAQSLPEAIRMAYYHRIDGLNIPDSVGMGPFTRILPYPVSRPWQTIDGYLGDLRLKKKLLPVIEEMIPKVRPEHKDRPWSNFKMFLNSWGSFVGQKKTDGDHLFVKNHIQDGVVYYIRDADVANMMILADPAEAIDRYCEHVLLRREGRFDFRPWAVPFESPNLAHSPSSGT